jgi:hypothetical protein
MDWAHVVGTAVARGVDSNVPDAAVAPFWLGRRNVASVFIPANDLVLKHLVRDSEWLQQQLGQYGPISSKFVTKFAYEVYPTRMLGRNIMVHRFYSWLRSDS